MIGSPEINKVIRQRLSPVLKQNGFMQVQGRHNWGWHGPCTWVLDIRAVGNHFASVTGWPPMSTSVWLGAFYDFVPLRFSSTIKLTTDGKILPQEVQCHLRSHLNIGLDQRQYTRKLSNPAEQIRTDLWWLDPDGGNVESVVDDIICQFLAEGMPWFERMTDISAAYAEIEKENDCFEKFSRIIYFAKYLKREAEYKAYRSKLEQEAHRIGRADWLEQYS